METYVRTYGRTKSWKPHEGRPLLGPAKITWKGDIRKTDKQTERKTIWHCESMTNSAQRAELVKTKYANFWLFLLFFCLKISSFHTLSVDDFQSLIILDQQFNSFYVYVDKLLYGLASGFIDVRFKGKICQKDNFIYLKK